MSCHRFPNVRELLQGDLNTKLPDGIKSLDFDTKDCNCRNKSNCIFKGECRQHIAVCEATCTATGKKHICNTQQPVKRRMHQPMEDAKRLAATGKVLDSFAEHFVELISQNAPKEEMAKHIICAMKILWKGKSIVMRKNIWNTTM